MEIQTFAVKNAKTCFILFFFVFASCAAQRRPISEEETIYSLLNHHYNLNQLENPGKFLYFETLSIKENPKFNWTKEVTLSKFLNDSIFKKECREIQKLLNNDEIKYLNEQFACLESNVLEKDKFCKNVLNRKFIQHETYTKTPNAANRRVSFPIILSGENYIYGFFVEDAHNAGGNLYFYEFKENEWKLICKDSLWLV